tara:strand:+ start:837 stop:1340 length:504 start_codon:yes stop_codon:yes gene_type:complete
MVNGAVSGANSNTQSRCTEQRLTWIADRGHEWLEVPYREVKHLLPQFKDYSFIAFNENKRDLMVYIEGDYHSLIYLADQMVRGGNERNFNKAFYDATRNAETIEVDRLEDYLNVVDRNHWRILDDPYALSNYAEWDRTCSKGINNCGRSGCLSCGNAGEIIAHEWIA